METSDPVLLTNCTRWLHQNRSSAPTVSRTKATEGAQLFTQLASS